MKINLFSDTKSNNFDTKGINKTQYKEKSISQIDIKDFKDDNLQLTTKLTKELIKKQQEELNYKKKLIYLKKRIEALKVKEDSMITEKNYFQKKKIIKERNIEIKNIQKKIIEEFKKKEKAYLKVNEDNSKLINEKEFKIQELKEKMNNILEEYSFTQKAKIDLENIILKQEEKVNQLGNKVNKIENILKNKNEEIKQTLLQERY